MNTQNTNENVLELTENSQVVEQKGQKINGTAIASIIVGASAIYLVAAKLLNWPPFGQFGKKSEVVENNSDELLDDTSDDDEDEE